MDPSNNLALLAATPRTWRFRGRDWLVSKLTPRAGGDLQRVIMEAYPDPRKLGAR